MHGREGFPEHKFKGKNNFKERGKFHPIKFEISVLQEQKKKAPDKLEKSMPQT